MVEKFKRGDIVLNRWAGPNNPTRKFIIKSIRGKKVNIIDTDGKNIRFSDNQYTNVYELFHDGKPAFVKIGTSKMFDVIRQELSDD